VAGDRSPSCHVGETWARDGVSGTDTGAGKDAASAGDELDVVVGHAADACDALGVQQQRLALRHSLGISNATMRGAITVVHQRSSTSLHTSRVTSCERSALAACESASSSSLSSQSISTPPASHTVSVRTKPCGPRRLHRSPCLWCGLPVCRADYLTGSTRCAGQRSHWPR
jgi:hypothetical protein